jgi:hypothetical protein
MTEDRRKSLLLLLVYATIIALIALVIFHQWIVKQRVSEAPTQLTRALIIH